MTKTVAVRGPDPRMVLGALVAAAAVSQWGIGVVNAGNDDAVLFGNQAIMSGGALTATVDDGSATWFNVAGLASVARDSVDVSGSLYQLRIGQTGGLLRSAAGQTTDANFVDFAVVPNALTTVRRLERNVVFGLGVFAPALSSHSDRLRLEENSGGGTSDWRLSLQDDVQSYLGSLALGFRIAPNLRFGAAIYGRYDRAGGYLEFLGAAEDEAMTTTFGIALANHFDTQRVSLALGAGIQWEPVPGLSIGVALQTPYVSLGSLAAELDASLIADPDAIVFEPDSAADASLRPEISLGAPARLRIGFALRGRRFVVALDADVQHALNNGVGVDRGWIAGARIGIRGKLDESISLGGGLFSDLSAARGAYEFGRTRAHYLGGSFGLELRSRHGLGVGESAGSIVFVQTFGVRYAYGLGRIGGLRFDLANDEAIESIAVRTSIHEVGLHVGSGVYF